MNYFLLSVRLLKSLKFELILVSLYCVILTVYSVNWFALNPFEFILYTRYFVFPGILLWSILSSRYHLKMFNNFPLKWLELNNLYQNPKRINYKIVSTSITLFIVVNLINGLVISALLQLIYASNLSMSLHIFKTYLAYYFLIFLFAWILGIYIGYLISSHSKTKQITYIITALILLTLTAYIDYSKNLNQFVNWGDQFIHPILNLGDLTGVYFLRLIFFITITLLFLFVIIFRDNFVIVLSIVSVILYLTITSFIPPNTIDQTLQMNDTKLYETLAELDDFKRQLDEDWELVSIEYLAEDNTPIKVRLDNVHKNEHINFSLNEQFAIAAITSEGKILDYTREKNLISVNTGGATEIEVEYEATIGTSIYPVLKEFTYLPFYSNWYPAKIHTNHFELDHMRNIEPNVETSFCKNPYILNGYSINFEIDNVYDCLSIIHGPFHHFELDEINWVVYIPFLTTKNNYSDLVNNIEEIKELVCRISNSGEDCIPNGIKGISIVPKSLSTSPVSVLDTVETNGYYHFNVNIFTDVGSSPITTHLSELAAVQLAYEEVKEVELSIFMGQYIVEVLNVESEGHIDLLVAQYDIEQEKWYKYKSLDLTAKEQYLKNY